MTTNQGDVFARAYVSLSVLQKNLNKMKDFLIEETYVKEYYSILDRLQQIGVDVIEFRIDTSEIKPRFAGGVIRLNGTSSQSYTNEKYVKRALLLIKVESVLGYFKLITEEPKRTIGFTHK